MPCRDRGWQMCTLGQGPSPQTAAVGEQGAGAEGCGHGTTRVTGTREHSDPGSEPVSRTESAPHRQEDARQTQVHKARARPTGSAQEQRPGDREDPTPRDGRGPRPQRAAQATGHCCPQGASSALAGQNREQENATRWGGFECGRGQGEEMRIDQVSQTSPAGAGPGTRLPALCTDAPQKQADGQMDRSDRDVRVGDTKVSRGASKNEEA